MLLFTKKAHKKSFQKESKFSIKKKKEKSKVPSMLQAIIFVYLLSTIVCHEEAIENSKQSTQYPEIITISTGKIFSKKILTFIVKVLAGSLISVSLLAVILIFVFFGFNDQSDNYINMVPVLNLTKIRFFTPNTRVSDSNGLLIGMILIVFLSLAIWGFYMSIMNSPKSKSKKYELIERLLSYVKRKKLECKCKGKQMEKSLTEQSKLSRMFSYLAQKKDNCHCDKRKSSSYDSISNVPKIGKQVNKLKSCKSDTVNRSIKSGSKSNRSALRQSTHTPGNEV